MNRGQTAIEYLLVLVASVVFVTLIAYLVKSRIVGA